MDDSKHRLITNDKHPWRVNAGGLNRYVSICGSPAFDGEMSFVSAGLYMTPEQAEALADDLRTAATEARRLAAEATNAA